MSKHTGSLTNLRAFALEDCDYYELQQDLGVYRSEALLPKGAIFVHDKTDQVKGSAAFGCLKLCYNPDDNLYGKISADTVIFHAEFRKTTLFKKVDSKKISQLTELIDKLTKQLEEAKNQLSELKMC